MNLQNGGRIQPEMAPFDPLWIIIGSDRRLGTKQGIEGKIVKFRSGSVRDRVRDKDRRSEPNTVRSLQ